MLKFESIEWLIALIGVLICAVMCWLYLRHSRRMESYFGRSAPSVGGESLFRWKAWSLTAAGLFIVIGLTNPQYGYRSETVERESADIYIALDISASMKSQDLSPSRLDRAKHIGANLIRALSTERIGLILFAGGAYMQMPLTHDYKSALAFLQAANTNQAGQQGTAIAEAIALASSRMHEEEGTIKSRMLILLSDGEDHEGKAIEAARTALGKGTTTFTIGIGTAEGGLIPTIRGGQSDYIRDESGAPVRTQLNPQTLQLVADAGGGLFFDYTVGDALYQDVKDKVERLERRRYDDVLFTARASYYQWFNLLGIIFLILPFVMKTWRVKKMNK